MWGGVGDYDGLHESPMTSLRVAERGKKPLTILTIIFVCLFVCLFGGIPINK